MKKTDLAYLASIMDGEGCILIRKQKYKGMHFGFYYQLVISISNTNEWLVNWVKFTFGGTIYAHRKPFGYKTVYQWSARANKAKILLEAIFPYLRIKRPQAEVALLFQSTRQHNSGGKIKSEEAVALDEAQRILIRSYNDRRGHKLEEIK